MKLLSICEAQARDFWFIPAGTTVFNGGYIDQAAIIYAEREDETTGVEEGRFVITSDVGLRTHYLLIDYVEGSDETTIVPACRNEKELEIALKNAKGTLIVIEEGHDDSLAFFAVIK